MIIINFLKIIFKSWNESDSIEEPQVIDPCNPSPCGPNAICTSSNGNALCECPPGYFGNPSTSGCRPECVISADCPRDKACVNSKCINPCPGVCGYEAICQVINHSPVCSCPPPLVGDPFTQCKKQPGIIYKMLFQILVRYNI